MPVNLKEATMQDSFWCMIEFVIILQSYAIAQGLQYWYFLSRMFTQESSGQFNVLICI